MDSITTTGPEGQPRAAGNRRARLSGGPRDERGQSIVELALIIPIAMLLLAGTLDMGRLFYARVAIENAAREGAVFGASDPRCDTAARTGCDDPDTADWRTRSEARGLNGLVTSFACHRFDAGTSTLVPRDSVADCLYGDTYEATVRDQFEFLTPILTPILGSSLTLEASAMAPVLTSASEPGAAFETWTPPEPSPTPTPAPTATPSPSPTPAPVACTVPDLVGLKVNSAEDAWHVRGVHRHAGPHQERQLHGRQPEPGRWQQPALHGRDHGIGHMRSSMSRLRRYRDASGQSLVEFALVAPILFLVILGLVDGGRIVFINNELSQAAQEGARWATVQGRAASEADGENTAVTDEIRSRIVVAPAPAITVSCTDLGAQSGSCGSGDLLSVSIRSSVSPITPIIGDIIGPLVLTAEAQMTVHG